MTEINLLPWREQKREHEKKMFATMVLGTVLATMFILLLINYYASELVSNQSARNKILQDEISLLNIQIKEIKALQQTRAALISRMLVVHNLQSTRVLIVHLFDELIKVLPSGMYVTKLERHNDNVTVTGFSESNTNVSLLMTNIEVNDWIQSPVLTEVKKMETQNQPADNEFKLSFVLKQNTRL